MLLERNTKYSNHTNEIDVEEINTVVDDENIEEKNSIEERGVV